MSKKISIIIFGASGDLMQRKLIPALFNLFRKRRLPEEFNILGFADTAWQANDFRRSLRAGLDKFAGYKFKEEDWASFESHLFYQPGQFTEASDIERMARQLAQLERGPAGRLYYLATPPRFFPAIVANLGRAKLVSEDEAWRRVVIEKPFGADLLSAQALNQSLYQVLREGQIYRIDHYLGKETVQNILIFRFANSIFEPVWNRNYIDHVQISVAEQVGVGHRAGYYDGVGVLRDMFQNHILQLLSLVAMEAPVSFEAEALRDEKVKVLKSVRALSADQVKGNLIQGQYQGYREEPGVAPASLTPTYAALRLFIDNWRWQGVPFYLRSGKRLIEKCTEIVIQFKCPPQKMFPMPAGHVMTPNMLALCLQPDEGIHLRFEAKVPDTPAEMRSVDMEFHYADSFGPMSIPEAYERLLLDAIQGDPTLFSRSDRDELAWKLIDPLIASLNTPGGPPLDIYSPGSWGPERAEQVLSKEGRYWLRGCGGH